MLLSVVSINMRTLHGVFSVADPHWAGDGSSGRRASLVQASNPWRVLHPASTCLPELTAQAASESNPAAAEYVTPLRLSARLHSGFLPADVFCVSSTSLLLLLQTKAHIHTIQVKAPCAHSSEQHLSVLLSFSNIHPCCLIVHPFLCRVHVPVALHEFDVYSAFFFFVFFFYNPKHLILNLLAMISVLPLLTQMFEFTTFSFVILCVQCLFSY